MGESLRFAHFSCIPTVHSLVNIWLQMLVRHIVVAANNHPSEMTPKTLNGVGKYITIGVLFITVFYYLVSIA